MWIKTKYTSNTHRDIMLMAEWAYNHKDFHKTKTREKHLVKGNMLSKMLRHRKVPSITINNK